MCRTAVQADTFIPAPNVTDLKKENNKYSLLCCHPRLFKAANATAAHQQPFHSWQRDVMASEV